MGVKRLEATPRGIQEGRLAVLPDAYMGLRAGELWALRRDDVDLLRGTLTVDEALSEVTAESAEQVPESERTERRSGANGFDCASAGSVDRVQLAAVHLNLFRARRLDTGEWVTP